MPGLIGQPSVRLRFGSRKRVFFIPVNAQLHLLAAKSFRGVRVSFLMPDERIGQQDRNSPTSRRGFSWGLLSIEFDILLLRRERILDPVYVKVLNLEVNFRLSGNILFNLWRIKTRKMILMPGRNSEKCVVCTDSSDRDSDPKVINYVQGTFQSWSLTEIFHDDTRFCDLGGK